MVFTQDYSERTPGPDGDAQSTVCLLDADSESDLQNVAPTADSPPAPEGSAPACVVQSRARKEMHRQCSGWKRYLLISAVIIILLMGNFALYFYMLFLNDCNHTLLQTLTEKLEAQSQILQQMATNQHLAGYNPGGL
ncbi:uncharacterized protein LOC143927448 [Lithobates pipiens]